jgi:glucosylceramidase
VTINNATTPTQVYFNTTYYVLGHIGKVATPGANVIATTAGTTTTVQSVGFQNPDGSIALVALNNGSSATTIAVSWNGQTFDYNLPAGAAASFKWPAH